MKLGKLTLVAISYGIALDSLWILAFDLNRTHDNAIPEGLRDDEIETSIAPWEVNVPTIVAEDSGHIHFGEVVS